LSDNHATDTTRNKKKKISSRRRKYSLAGACRSPRYQKKEGNREKIPALAGEKEKRETSLKGKEGQRYVRPVEERMVCPTNHVREGGRRGGKGERREDCGSIIGGRKGKGGNKEWCKPVAERGKPVEKKGGSLSRRRGLRVWNELEGGRQAGLSINMRKKKGECYVRQSEGRMKEK